MFNITDAIAALRDADTIISSSILSEEDKGRLLADLKASVPPAFNRPYLTVLTEALDRLYDVYRLPEAGPTEGFENTAPVATRTGAAIAAPFQGTTEGLQEQAQDAGLLACFSNDGFAPTEAAAPTEKPKASKARK